MRAAAVRERSKQQTNHSSRGEYAVLLLIDNNFMRRPKTRASNRRRGGRRDAGRNEGAERERDAFDIFFGQLIKLLKGAHEHRWNHYYLK